jgi:hypothetical protein
MSFDFAGFAQDACGVVEGAANGFDDLWRAYCNMVGKALHRDKRVAVANSWLSCYHRRRLTTYC